MTAPHVVGIVGNDIVNDSRVKKTAAAMAAAGYRSTILCYTPDDDRTSTMGDVEVRRVHVPFTLRDQLGRAPQMLRPFVGTELAARHVGPRQARIARKRRKEAAVAAGRGHPVELWLERVGLLVPLQAYRLRGRAHVTWDRGARLLLRTRALLGRKLRARAARTPGQALDYELTFGPALVELRPDVIHAHDMHMIGVAVTSARLLRSQGIDTKVVYDAHELVEGLSYPRHVIDGWLREEGAHIHEVDAVIGVSAEQVARIRERYSLETVPAVVMNAPPSASPTGDGPTIRDETDADHLLVYHGNVAESRGVFDLVDALTHLPDGVHAAFVAPLDDPVVSDIEERARALGVDGRVHLFDFVPSDRLGHFIGSADIEVIPYRFTGNNDIALPNKLFEAIQAGLPVLTSDMSALRRFQHDHGTGLVHRHGDPADLAAKAMEMLEHLDEHRSRLTPELRRSAGWDAQADRLVAVHDAVLGRPSSPAVHVGPEAIEEDEPPPARRTGNGPGLAIGPRNMAGQAFRMARAVERHLGIPSVSFALENGRFDFPSDHRITTAEWRDPAWQANQLRLVTTTCSHVLTESGTGILGAVNGGFVDEQLSTLRNHGVEVAVLLHGSEIRDPRRHRRLPHSPYASDAPLIKDLEAATARLRRHLDGLDVPLFVTTPDLLEDVDATWLPVVIDVDEWSRTRPAFQNDVPTVLHLPSNGLLKGSDHVDEVLFRLQAEGEINYLRPTDAMRPPDVAAVIEKADIVIDGIVLGAYGVMSCQTMAAGRLAVANLRDLGELRRSCPIVDAGPATLDETLRELLRDRSTWEARAVAGREFVATHHDGTSTANILSDFLGAS